MSLESMKIRLNYWGGATQNNRMIESKLWSFKSARQASYAAAHFTTYPNYDEHKSSWGLMNAKTINQDYDTKMVSVEFDSGFKVGTVFKWLETNTYWIIFIDHKTELAYFRGDCRRCDYTASWVDGDRRVQTTPMSVIGPSTPSLATSSSMQATLAEDFPNADLKIMVPDNEKNNVFFKRYQTFLLKGITYQVEQVDDLSMPGVIQLNCKEYYGNRIEDDVEENLRNAWNVQPIIEESPSEYMIEGPDTVKPKFVAEFKSLVSGGEWVLVDGKNTKAVFEDLDTFQDTIHVKWDSMMSGQYTLGYKTKNGELYQKNILVESLM